VGDRRSCSAILSSGLYRLITLPGWRRGSPAAPARAALAAARREKWVIDMVRLEDAYGR